MRFTSALCIYPESPAGAPSYKYFPPLGLETIATVIENSGIPVTIIDRRHELDLAPHLKGADQLIAISVNWDYELLTIPQILREIPAGRTVVLGGRAATTHVEELFRDNPSVTAIARGDGEEIIREICTGKPFEDVESLSFEKEGQIVHNPNRAIKPMDDDLLVNRSLRRARYGSPDFGVDIDFIATSSGCPYHCKFCNFSNNPLGQKRKWTGRSPESVVRELETITSKNIFITDDNFAVDMKRVERICDLIMEKGIKKNMAAAVRIDVARDPRVVEKMYRAGIKLLFIGLEAATDRLLGMMQKGFTTAEAIEAFKVLRKQRFYIHGYFIVGNFAETKEDMLQIPAYANQLDLDTFDAFILRTDKYSPLNQIMQEYPGYHVEVNNYEMQIYSDTYSIADLNDIRDEITRRYYTAGNIFKFARRLMSTGAIGVPSLLRYVGRRVRREVIPLFLPRSKAKVG